jgi:hypothetical protein
MELFFDRKEVMIKIARRRKGSVEAVTGFQKFGGVAGRTWGLRPESNIH